MLTEAIFEVGECVRIKTSDTIPLSLQRKLGIVKSFKRTEDTVIYNVQVEDRIFGHLFSQEEIQKQ